MSEDRRTLRIDHAVLRLKKSAVLDIVNVWVQKNFVQGVRAVAIDPSADGEQFQIVLESELGVGQEAKK